MSEETAGGRMKKIFDLSPRDEDDYFHILFWRIGRKLSMLILGGMVLVCAAAAAFLALSGALAGAAEDGVVLPYDSLFLKFYDGDVKIRAADGHIAYSGGVKDGGVNGEGVLMDASGGIVYEGEFAHGLYSGEGTLYRPGGMKQYEGGFASGEYSGEGVLYGPGANAVYTGNFIDGHIVYEELLGIPTSQVSERYDGRQVLYGTEDKTYAVLEDIGVIYCASAGGDSLEEEWTTEKIYVMSAQFPVGEDGADTGGMLDAYFKETAHTGSAAADVPDILACTYGGGLEGFEDTGETVEAEGRTRPLMEMEEVYEDVYEVRGTDRTYRFGVRAYEQDGLRYVFYFHVGSGAQDGFLFYTVAETETDQ